MWSEQRNQDKGKEMIVEKGKGPSSVEEIDLEHLDDFYFSEMQGSPWPRCLGDRARNVDCF